MDDLARQELDAILNDPNYDQSMLIGWFRGRYGADWQIKWNQYQETGRI